MRQCAESLPRASGLSCRRPAPCVDRFGNPGPTVFCTGGLDDPLVAEPITQERLYFGLSRHDKSKEHTLLRLGPGSQDVSGFRCRSIPETSFSRAVMLESDAR